MAKSYVIAAKSSQVIEDSPVAANVQGRHIGLYRLGDEIYAIDNICPHQNALLTDGYIEDGCIECPLHQARFDIKTGAVISGPVDENLRSYPIRIEQGLVMVELEEV